MQQARAAHCRSNYAKCSCCGKMYKSDGSEDSDFFADHPHLRTKQDEEEE